MDTAALPAFRESISGQVVLPGDNAYDQKCNIFVHAGEPAVIVVCADAADVGKSIAFARAQDLVLSVRSGGHSNAGYSTNIGGMVIDLSPLNSVEVIDEENRIVRIGTGARWGDVAATLGPRGLAVSSGDTSTVGVGGLMLGGGIGWMVRKHSLAIDSLIAAEVVTADGKVVRASIEEHPELLWAIRGGGGNFGAVTSFDVAAQPVRNVHFGTLSFPAAEAATVLKGWSAYMRTATEDLTTTAQLYPAFGEEPPPLFIKVCFAGDDAEAAATAVDPIRKLGTLVDEEFTLMAYGDILEAPSELPAGWEPRVKNRFAASCGDDLIDTITGNIRNLSNLFVEIRSIGGAIGRVPEDATAFAHRDAEVMVMTALLGSVADNAPLVPQFDAFWASLAPYTAGAYSNFLSVVEPDDIANAYPAATHERLAAVKATYDPTNIFDQNPNINPRG